MDKLKKVIKGLECCTNSDMSMCLDECPYHTDGCSGGIIMMRDALSLLKAQEAKWVHREDMDFKDKNNNTHYHEMCTNCGFIHDFIDGHTGRYLYCPQCGKVVKWE